MPPKVEAAQENITHIIRGLSFFAILWVVNTTNTTATNLSVLTNDVQYIKQHQVDLRQDSEKLELQIEDLDDEIDEHKDKDKH